MLNNGLINDELFDFFINSDLQSKSEIYRFIENYVIENNIRYKNIKNKILELLEKREKIGDLLIAENVILPHAESELIEKSKILIIKPKKIIKSWNNTIKNVKLIIVVILKENENPEIKEKISKFSRKLANDEFLEKLKNIDNKQSFWKL